MESAIEKKKMKLAEILFDDTDMSEIVLKNREGKRIRFGQVYATIMEENICCILSPIDVIEGVAPDSALPFRMGEDGELKVADRTFADRLFEKYYLFLEKQSEKKEEKDE